MEIFGSSKGLLFPLIPKDMELENRGKAQKKKVSQRIPCVMFMEPVKFLG